MAVWVRTMALALIAGVLAVAGAGAAESPADSRMRQFSFENGLDGWTTAPRAAPGAVAGTPGPPVPRLAVVAKGRSGQAVEITLEDAASATLRREKATDLSPFQTLRFDVLVPRLGGQLHAAVYFIDSDDCWYQTWRPLIPKPEVWQTVEVDLRGESGAFEPVGHSRPWGPYAARGVKEVGICFFADRFVRGALCIDNITCVPAPESSTRQEVYNFETSSDPVGRYRKFEITFELTRTYENPFDPAQVEVTGLFTTPGGAEVRVPGFFYQDYERRLDRKVERLVPVGSPKWKVRFSPRELGTYTYRMLVADTEKFQTPPRRFTCAPSGDPGFVRVCPEDVRCFEFENDTVFYPIGHNIPATFNVKAAESLGMTVEKFEGTAAYDRFLDGMKGAGENYARLWLAYWSFAVEGSPVYHPSYKGLGRYNQENAWRLDYVMEKADRYNIYVQLALMTFGHLKAGSSRDEGDWGVNPYNTVNGGPIGSPQQFWTHPGAQELYQRMVRYAMARWGYASHLAAWEVSNEIDLVTGYKEHRAEIVAWHKRCAETVRRFDPNGHLLTTNFANASNDGEILALPDISFSSTNHYTIQVVDVLRKNVFPAKSAFKKPAIMAESGDSFQGSTPEVTDRYIHIILWGSHMIPFAGAAMPWWWDYIDDRGLYPMFMPLVEYARGEDRRGQKLESADGALLNSAGGAIAELAALSLQNDHQAYVWVYEKGLLRGASAAAFMPESRQNVTLQLPGLKPGAYTVEFWDTWKGGKLQESAVACKDGALLVPLPGFTTDLALKIRPSAP